MNRGSLPTKICIFAILGLELAQLKRQLLRLSLPRRHLTNGARARQRAGMPARAIAILRITSHKWMTY
jgi:hypothetical protein